MLVLAIAFDIVAGVALFRQAGEVEILHTSAPARSAARASLVSFIAAHPGASVAIAPGPTRVGDDLASRHAERHSSWLAAAGMPLVIADLAWIDMSTPANARRLIQARISSCGVTNWLTHGDPPFGGDNQGPAILAALRQNYEKVDKIALWDVWSCRAPLENGAAAAPIGPRDPAR